MLIGLGSFLPLLQEDVLYHHQEEELSLSIQKTFSGRSEYAFKDAIYTIDISSSSAYYSNNDYIATFVNFENILF